MPEPSAPTRTRRRRLRWLLPALVLAAVAFDVTANLYLISAARAATLPDVASAPARPYAIVLGNRVGSDGEPSDELAARLETALALYRAGRAGKIVASGMVRRAYDEPRAMAAWLRAHGVAPGDIVTDGGGHRTSATMADAAALGIRAALVVTQGYHLPRALYLARHAGIDALGVPAESRRTGWGSHLKLFCRESTARAETVVEVALRGVR
jgi:SanA protein